MRLRGKAIKVGDSISTDLICPGRFFHLRHNLPELAKHVFEDLDPRLAKRIKPGYFMVAGKNFGLGSSREHAARILKIAGLNGILAQSFARIFFRNAINVGLSCFVCDTEKINDGDILELDVEKGILKDETRAFALETKPLPRVMQDILKEGGLVPYIRKYKCLR